jgi:mannan polymerase II complex MNN10 subunit
MIEDAIDTTRYEWIWWLDYDTLITNTTVKLTDIIDNTLRSRPDRDNIDLILTPDWYVLV